MARPLGLSALTAWLLFFFPGALCGRWASTRGTLRIPKLRSSGPERTEQDQPGLEHRSLGSVAGQGRSDMEVLGGLQDCTWSFLDSRCPDVRALLAFKANNMDPFGKLSSWTIPCSVSVSQNTCPQLSQHICSTWRGINCTSLGRVRAIVISPGNGDSPQVLFGNFSVGQSIPPEFGDLEELDYLDLSLNFNTASYLGGLIGPLPLQLSLLTKLSYMDLNSNLLWGQLPGWLTALTGLTYLDLGRNNFTGLLPPELGQMQNLVRFSAAYNPGLYGPIPSQLGNLQALQYLALGYTDISESIPDALSKLTSLTTLDFHYARLSGALPTWWASFSSLSALDLSNNQLTGTLPASLGMVPALNSLVLAANHISGVISEELMQSLCNTSRPTLATLDLSRNRLTGSLPSALSGCSGLMTLQLTDNQLNGPFPDVTFFSLFTGLFSLGLSNNQLSGTVPSNIMNLTSLSSLSSFNIQDNNFSGPMPRIFCKQAPITVNFSGNAFTGNLSDVLSDPALATCVMPAFGEPGSPYYFPPMLANMTLDFSRNQLTGPISSSLLSLATLQYAKFDENLLSGNIILPLGANCSTGLSFFSAARNQLTGSLPAGLGNCTALQLVDLSENQLEGPIPAQIVGIGNSLQSLQLQGNHLSGGLPSNIDLLQQLFDLNLSSNNLSLPLPPRLANLRNLQVLDLSNNQITGELPPAMGDLSVVRVIELQNNLLSGSIPVSLAPPNLPLLTFLDLSNNHLSGGIPPGFANSSVQNLTINLASNNLSGPVPGGSTSLFGSTQPESVVANNPLLCGGLNYPPCPQSPSGISGGAIAGICVGAVAGVLLILGVAFWFIRKKSHWAGGTMMVFEKLDFPLTVDHILEATENFSDKYKLGKGGFGTVYRAMLQDGRTVAIKRLATQSRQGDREFQAEMQTLGNIRHRNLVVLVAAYVSPPPAGERLLIYNFLSGGSLDTILSSSKAMPKESPYCQWELRRSIALDVARGLKYLHHDCTPRIIHRDMKPANVLMDDQLVAHVADFGLAREVDNTKSHMSTAVFGTIGYLAPEYTQRGRLTFKSDVFAYGVLLLQLITGKQPTDEDVAERGLARWVGASNASAVIDRRLEIGTYMNEILGAVKLGLLCTSRVPADRPTMAEVVHLLENLDDFALGSSSSESF